MLKQVIAGLIIMIGAACATGGCAIARKITTPDTDLASVGNEIPVMTFDDELVQVAHHLPGFGGMFFDAEGVLNIYLTDANPGGTEKSPAELGDQINEALLAVFGPEILTHYMMVGLGAEAPTASPMPARMKIIQGTYDLAQLAAWRPAVNRTLALPGVVLTDLDESKNRLRVGIDSPQWRRQVERELEQQGIPRDAVLIEETDRTYLLQSPIRLQDRIRPLTAGLRIASADKQFCTLGFNAYLEATDNQGFVTASHCTGVRGGKSAVRFFQHETKGRANYIGVEHHDPLYFIAAPEQHHRCQPPHRRCRYSDSVFVRYAEAVPVENGRIARPTDASGSIVIDQANPIFWVTHKGPMAIAGQLLHKVGASMGWTSGRVSHTCVDVPAFYLDDSDTGITLLCQTGVVATADNGLMVGPGDSGAPVFVWRNQHVSHIDLYGIVWGGNTDGSRLTFSPLRSIEQELGKLSLQAPAAPVPQPPGVPAR
jgi:hypothetical protein